MEDFDPHSVRETISEDVIRRYLLRDPDLSAEERSVVEGSYFSNEDLYQYVLGIEDELIDEYLAGELSLKDRALFQQSLEHSARWQEKVALVQGLVRYTSEHPEKTFWDKVTAWWRSSSDIKGYRVRSFALAGAAIVILGATLSIVRYSQFAVQHDPTESAGQQPPTVPPGVGQGGSQSPPVEPSPQSSPKTTVTPVVAFILLPGATRSEGTQPEITVPVGNYLVRLRMSRRDESFGGYEANLSTPDNTVISRVQHLKPAGSGSSKEVVVDVPSGRLAPGVYILNLKGEYSDGRAEDLEDYVFKVVR